MPRDKSISHEKIIRAAIEEFAEYGYDGASMRSIGERCGLTAAALYRHFDSKEAMFEELVKPAVDELYSWIERHVEASRSAVENVMADTSDCGMEDLWKSSEIDMMRELVYPRMPEYEMLLNKSRGSKYGDFLNDLVDTQTKIMLPYFKSLRKLGYEVKEISEEELHMLITAYCAALFEPVAHGYSLEDAVNYLDTVEAFFLPGWKNLLGFSTAQ